MGKNDYVATMTSYYDYNACMGVCVCHTSTKKLQVAIFFTKKKYESCVTQLSSNI